MAGLDQVLEELVQACTPTKDDYDKRTRLIERAEFALQRLGGVEGVRVRPYGSFVSGFYNSTSDLDLAIIGRMSAQRLRPAVLAEIFHGGAEESYVSLHKLDKGTKSRLLRDAGRLLTQARVAERGSVEYILHARVPIIKFRCPESGLEVDLCLGHDATAFKAWSVAQVAAIHPAFGKLFRVVKVWAKAHAINDGASHMFNSWCLTLVVMFFLQTHYEQALLPPLHALLYDNEPDVRTPRLMQQGAAEVPEQVYQVMALRATAARELLGPRPCRPLAQLFRDFVEDGGRKLRSLLASQEAFHRGTRMSAFYGRLLEGRPYPKPYVMCVEDPYDDTDNTARTLGTWDSHPGTIHYVTSVFERTLRHLDRHLGTPTTPPATPLTGAPPETSAGASTSASSSSFSGSDGPSGDTSESSATSPSLAPTLMFLFGTELLTRLPVLAESLLGRPLCEDVRARLAAGRPAGEVHEALLRMLGAADEFVSFESFKRRHKIRVHNEAKYATPEEKAAAAAKEAARRAQKKEKERVKQAARKEKQAAAMAAATGSTQEQGQGQQGLMEEGQMHGALRQQVAEARRAAAAASVSRGSQQAPPDTTLRGAFARARRPSATSGGEGGGAAVASQPAPAGASSSASTAAEDRAARYGARSGGGGGGGGSEAGTASGAPPRITEGAKAAVAQLLQGPRAGRSRSRTASQDGSAVAQAMMTGAAPAGAGLPGAASAPVAVPRRKPAAVPLPERAASAAAAAAALASSGGNDVTMEAAAAAAAAALEGSRRPRKQTSGVSRSGSGRGGDAGGGGAVGAAAAALQGLSLLRPAASGGDAGTSADGDAAGPGAGGRSRGSRSRQGPDTAHAGAEGAATEEGGERERVRVRDSARQPREHRQVKAGRDRGASASHAGEGGGAAGVPAAVLPQAAPPRPAREVRPKGAQHAAPASRQPVPEVPVRAASPVGLRA